MSKPIETSPGGSVLVKTTYNEAWEQPLETPYEAELNAHMDKWLGPAERVFHETVSDAVHIDVHLVLPTETCPLVRLYTTGLSARPMQVPAGAEHLARAELMLTLLPDTLDLLPDMYSTEPFWPAELLRFLARYPHKASTWISYDHTMPLELKPFAGVMFVPSTFFAHGQFSVIPTTDGELINVLSVLPVYQEELDLKLAKGADALYDLFNAHKVHELWDPIRTNVGAQGWRTHLSRWLGRR